MNIIRNQTIKNGLATKKENELYNYVYKEFTNNGGSLEEDENMLVNLYLYNLNCLVINGFELDSTRSDRNPEKWVSLYKKRTEDSKIIKVEGLHKCGRCNSWYTNYEQKQRASADEPMCISVSCLDCGHCWKYS